MARAGAAFVEWDDAERRRARRLGWATGLLLAVLVLLACPGRAEVSYPRLANIYFPTLAGADLEKLARWDLVVLTTYTGESCGDELETLRQLNPDIKLIVHMPVGYHGGWTCPSALGGLRDALDANGWWLMDTAGEIVTPPFGFGIMNMTTSCAPDGQGQRLCDWLPEHIASHLGPGGTWDGIFLDFCMDDISWVSGYIPNPIDANGDGIADTRAELDAWWKSGMRRMADRLRELVGDDYTLITNGNNTLYDVCDGSTRENFPFMHGGWYENVMHPTYGYASNNANYRQPAVNIVNSIWAGEAGPNGPQGNLNYERQLRFGLATTLVYGDGYFSFDGLDGEDAHSHMWWHPLYDVDLGQPVGRVERVTACPGALPGMVNGEYLRLRRFTKGIVIVNPTGALQAADLGGMYYMGESWNGQFFERSGAVHEVLVHARSGAIVVGRGHMLASSIVLEVVGRGVGGSPEVSWDALPGAERYSVYRSRLDGSVPGEPVLVGVVDTPTFVDDSAAQGMAYRYAVAGIDSSGCEGQLSRPVEVSTEPGSDLHVHFTVDILDGRLTLAWTVSENTRVAIMRTGARGERAAVGDGPQDGPGRLVDESAVPGEAYEYELVEIDGGAERVLARARSRVPVDSAGTALLSCSPNPAAGETLIRFSIGGVVGRGDVARASLTIHDAAGRVVKRLADGPLPSGLHEARWAADDEAGNPVASGCYFCALTAEGRTDTAKLLVIR